MRRPKLTRWRVAVVGAGTLAAFLAMPFPYIGGPAVADVQEAAIRYLLHHNASGLQDRLQVCFVGLGSSFGEDEPHDPPREFLERFADFPVPVHPVSEVVHARPRGPGHVDSPDGGVFGHVADKEGRPGLVFAAGDVRRWSGGVAVCRGHYYEAGLSAAEYDIYLIRVPFGWVPVYARVLWVS